MSKSAYMNHNVIGEIEAAINILCEEHRYCTPTDVLRMLGYEETCLTRSLVCNIALMLEYRVISSGRGFRITDW